jgi:hypothetical protein
MKGPGYHSDSLRQLRFPETLQLVYLAQELPPSFIRKISAETNVSSRYYQLRILSLTRLVQSNNKIAQFVASDQFVPAHSRSTLDA